VDEIMRYLQGPDEKAETKRFRALSVRLAMVNSLRKS